MTLPPHPHFSAKVLIDLSSSWLPHDSPCRLAILGQYSGTGHITCRPGTDQTQPQLRGAQLWGGQSLAHTIEGVDIWYLAWQFKCNLEKTCLECDDFLQLCQVDFDFPNFNSVIIWTEYRIECLLSNVSISRHWKKFGVYFTMFYQISDVSAYPQVRQDARLPIWSQEGQDKVRT